MSEKTRVSCRKIEKVEGGQIVDENDPDHFLTKLHPKWVLEARRASSRAFMASGSLAAAVIDRFHGPDKTPLVKHFLIDRAQHLT